MNFFFFFFLIELDLGSRKEPLWGSIICGGCAGDSKVKGRIRMEVRIGKDRGMGYGWRIGVRYIMMGDPVSKIKSGAVNYMRWEMIPVLDAAGKE